MNPPPLAPTSRGLVISLPSDLLSQISKKLETPEGMKTFLERSISVTLASVKSEAILA
jgi:hypothetical protein